jgi:hypothetical protein
MTIDLLNEEIKRCDAIIKYNLKYLPIEKANYPNRVKNSEIEIAVAKNKKESYLKAIKKLNDSE